MTSLQASVFLCCVLALAMWLTSGMRRYAVARQLLDIPNARSSHSRSTPRRSVAIVVISAAASLFLGLTGQIGWGAVIGVVGGGAIVATVGFADDHRHVPVIIRLLSHVAAAFWFLVWFGSSSSASVWAVSFGWPSPQSLAAGIYVVCLINLTNFMDGIDGIASVEAITVCIGGVILYFILAPERSPWLMPACVAAATAGFLYWDGRQQRSLWVTPAADFSGSPSLRFRFKHERRGLRFFSAGSYYSACSWSMPL